VAGILLGIVIVSSGEIFALPPATTLATIPADLGAAMTQIAPALFRGLLACCWFGLLLRLFYVIRNVSRRGFSP
jgi:hypothetical protein